VTTGDVKAKDEWGKYLRREGRQVNGLRGVRCGSPWRIYLLFCGIGLLYEKYRIPPE